jgi:hypothetical protein
MDSRMSEIQFAAIRILHGQLQTAKAPPEGGAFTENKQKWYGLQS